MACCLSLLSISSSLLTVVAVTFLSSCLTRCSRGMAATLSPDNKLLLPLPAAALASCRCSCVRLVSASSCARSDMSMSAEGLSARSDSPSFSQAEESSVRDSAFRVASRADSKPPSAIRLVTSRLVMNLWPDPDSEEGDWEAADAEVGGSSADSALALSSAVGMSTLHATLKHSCALRCTVSRTPPRLAKSTTLRFREDSSSLPESKYGKEEDL